MSDKKWTTENAFGGRSGFQGLFTKVKGKKAMKLFPSFEDAEKEVGKVPKPWGKKR